jgi:MoaA/NifB/PqqE/SkfB family radical SAM enzyme
VPELTLLWALRSPCSLGCRYCYFGTIEEHRIERPTKPGLLSHLSRNDLTAEEVFAFAATMRYSAIRRVFLAGGEPLLWPPVLDLIHLLKTADIQVVVCTNGIPLNRPDITDALVERGVDAVSVSLDSADPDHNDTWRPARNGRDGWSQIVTGTRTLLTARADRQRPQVGLYSVITRRNMPDILAVPALAAQLGCDYAVPQPVALAPDHALYGELALTPADIPTLRRQFAALQQAKLPLRTPTPPYPDQVASAVASPTGLARGCFGGHTLFFVEPDGSVWDCPSSLRIAATAPEHRRSIRGADAADLFPAPTGCAKDCSLFSVDCVNMWPLMGFDDLIAPTAAGSAA